MRLLQEYIDELVLERLRGGFDIRQFKSLTDPEEIWDYVEAAGLRKLGSGTGRAVFLLSSGKVLKLAKDFQGTDQIRDEWETYKRFGKSGMFARVFDVDPNFWWMIMETVRSFQSNQQLMAETGLDDDLLQTFAAMVFGETATKKGFNNFMARTKAMLADHARKSANWKIKYEKFLGINPTGMELLYKFFILTLKYRVDDIDRFDHWGKTADGRIVCIDYGLTATAD